MTPKTTKNAETQVDLFQAPALPAVRQGELKPVRRLTMDATSLPRLGQAIVLVTGELGSITMNVPGKAGEQQEVPAIEVRLMPLGEERMLICNVVMASAFRRAGTPLAGRYFAMRAGEIKEGKHYRQIDIVELELVK